MEKPYRAIGQRIRAYRLVEDLSVPEMCVYLALSRSQYYRIEAGDNAPTCDTLLALRALGCDPLQSDG
jgi:transcriptional regulator with XRE-family HTH domain